MPFAETLSPFFADFAMTVTLGGASVQAIFDNGYSRGDVGLAGLAGAQPSLMLPTAAVPSNVVGATAVVAGTSYVVAEHQPDGTGVSTLLLERA